MGIYGKTAVSWDAAAISEIMQPIVEQGFYNATIDIIDPHIEVGAYNRMTNVKDRSALSILWSGPSRIQAVRWPNVATARQEAISIRTVVFHIPRYVDLDPSLIMEGYRIHVTDAGGLAPEFEDGLFVITSSTNSSYAWDRRIETVMDQGAVITL